jgi:hypothetical protein
VGKIPSGWRAAAAVLLLASACAREPAELPEQGVEFWTVPELPTGAALEVNGRAVDPELVRAYLLPLWAERWDDHADRAEATRAFFAAPRALFEPLVRGVLLLQEAERRWPTLEEPLLAAADAEMQRVTGAVYEALRQRIGAAGVRAHLERELRKRLLLEAFGAEAEPVREEEVYERYEAMLTEVDDPAALARRGVDFAASAPQIRAELERARAVERQEAWLDAQEPTARVRATVPGGAVTAW